MRWAIFGAILIAGMLAHTIASASTDGGERAPDLPPLPASPSSLAADTNACLGDINADEYIDITDISLVGAYFGKAVPPAPANYDVTGDGYVDISDVTTIGARFGQHCISATYDESFSSTAGKAAADAPSYFFMCGIEV